MIQAIESYRSAGAPHSNNRRPDFIPEKSPVTSRNIENPVEKAFHGSGNTRIINRGSEYNTIGILHALNSFVKLIAGSGALFIFIFRAVTTSQATSYRFISNMDDFKINTVFFQSRTHHPKGMVSISFFFRTSVNCYYFH
jgi:hypothetical protein